MPNPEIHKSDVAHEIKRLQAIVKADPDSPLKAVLDAVPDGFEPEGVQPEPPTRDPK